MDMKRKLDHVQVTRSKLNYVAFGTIDHTYNKEIGIITDNIGDEAIVVKAGTLSAISHCTSYVTRANGGARF